MQGLNDAGVENFQGAIDVYLSRECGQNTADAPRKNVETVRLEFDRISISPNDIPGFSDLEVTLKACLEKWKGKEKEREFFELAVEMAAKDQISLLKISDYGTTGLMGDDEDELGRWVALVKSQGISNKGDTAGGSFGIGKSSPFAASRFRTVFYGTKTEDGNVALQGVSRLVTHKNADDKLTQGTGFIGGYDPQGGIDGEPIFRAVRSESMIPPMFRRTEPGTDIWVIGYRSGSEWDKDLIRSILSNFWPAIHRGSIQFRVGKEKIEKENLPNLIAQYIGSDEFEAHHYYKAILAQPIKKSLKYTGACELYLTTASVDLPRKICMVRGAGMRIYDYQPRACRVPFSGIFICTDLDGNKLLRKLEPPKHDVWDPKRIEGDVGEKALQEIKIWIREEVKKLNPLFAGSSFNETELAKYVSDPEPNEANDVPSDEKQDESEEDLEPKTRSVNPQLEEIKTQAVVVNPGRDLEGKNKASVNGGGGGGEGGGGGGGEKKNAKVSPPVIRVRSYRSGNDTAYVLVLRSDTDFKGPVSIQAVGEDGEQNLVSLVNAKAADESGSVYSVSGDVIQDISIIAGVPLRVIVSLEALERRSLTAISRI